MLVVLPETFGDLRSVRQWYEANRPAYKERFFERFRETLKRIEEEPLRFQVAETRWGVRRALIRRSPYVVGFLVRPRETLLLGVIHGARHPRVWVRRARLVEGR